MGKEYYPKPCGICEYVYTNRGQSLILHRNQIDDGRWELIVDINLDILDINKSVLGTEKHTISMIFDKEPTQEEQMEFIARNALAKVCECKKELAGFDSKLEAADGVL